MPRKKAEISDVSSAASKKTEETQEKKTSIEENFAQLEDIIRRRESGDSTLEEAFACYEAGMKLVRSLNSQIDNVEKQIQILSEGDDNE